MTQKLFWEDSYLKEFQAEVVKVQDKFIILDKTCFYPKSGGQANDTGILTRINDNKKFQVVFAAKINEDVSHEVNEVGLKIGDKVKGRIDWERRYKLMRFHTACHLLDAVFQEDGEVLITGNELNTDKSRIDFNLKDFNREKVQHYIDKANELIKKDLEVKNYYLKKEDALKIQGIIKLAKAAPPDLEILRITEIPNIDIQADGGTHIKSLKEIGKIVLLGIENKGKERKRVYFDVINNI